MLVDLTPDDAQRLGGIAGELEHLPAEERCFITGPVIKPEQDGLVGMDWVNAATVEVMPVSEHRAALERVEAEAREIEAALQAESDDNFRDLEKAEARTQEAEAELANEKAAHGVARHNGDTFKSAYEQAEARAQAAEQALEEVRAERDRFIGAVRDSLEFDNDRCLGIFPIDVDEEIEAIRRGE